MYQFESADSHDLCSADILLVEGAFADGWTERLEGLGYPVRRISVEEAALIAGGLTLVAVGGKEDLDTVTRLLAAGIAVVLLFERYEPVLFNQARALKPLGYLFPPYDQGSVAGVLQAAVDRCSTEHQCQEVNTRLSDAQSLAHLGHWEWDLETGYVQLSDEAYRILGIEVGAIRSFESHILSRTEEKVVSRIPALTLPLDEYARH